MEGSRRRTDGKGPPAPRGSSPRKPPSRFPISRGWIVFALLLFALNFYLGSRATQPPSRVRVPYSPFFLNQVNAGRVKEITSKGTAIQGTFNAKLRYGKSKPTTRFKTEVPAFANTDTLSALLQKKRVVVNAQPLDTAAPWWQSLLLGFGPTILFVLLLFWLMRRAGSAQNLLGTFGRSRARRYQPSGDRVTFADVAGIDEAKRELTEVVDFLRHPEKYRRLGGRIPHGVLLSGPPGTGKTLLARAVAGEADVPFFSMAASEFVEAIVGVGASRVRDLFTQAKEDAPAIVFIDELDPAARPCRPPGDPRGARPRRAAGPRRRPRPDRGLHAGHGRRRSREPRQRGRASGRATQPRSGRGVRSHRRTRTDRARCRASGDDEPRRPAPHRVSRSRPRDRRHAHRRRRPRAQGLDHPARDGARSHVCGARERPLQLSGARGQGKDRRRTRRARRRGGRIRGDQHRRGVRHRAAHRHCPPDGRPLGDELRARAGRRAAARGREPIPSGRGRGVAAHTATARRRGAAPRRRVTRASSEPSTPASRQARFARGGAARARDSGRGRRLRRRGRGARCRGDHRHVRRRGAIPNRHDLKVGAREPSGSAVGLAGVGALEAVLQRLPVRLDCVERARRLRTE